MQQIKVQMTEAKGVLLQKIAGSNEMELCHSRTSRPNNPISNLLSVMETLLLVWYAIPSCWALLPRLPKLFRFSARTVCKIVPKFHGKVSKHVRRNAKPCRKWRKYHFCIKGRGIDSYRNLGLYWEEFPIVYRQNLYADHYSKIMLQAGSSYLVLQISVYKSGRTASSTLKRSKEC